MQQFFQAVFDHHGIPCAFINGLTSTPLRDSMIRQFNEGTLVDDRKQPVNILVITGVVSTGINLHGATVAILVVRSILLPSLSYS